MKKILTITLIAFTLFSCEKEEELLPGRFLTDQVGRADMRSGGGVDYQMQLYFDLSSGKLKAENPREIWDLALGCNPQNPNLFVNSAMLQAVAATGSTDFSANYDPANFDIEFERSDRFYNRGSLQSDFENGQPKGEVFIIDMGRNLQNQKRGHKLLQILNFADGSYTLRIANLDHSNQQEVQVQMDDTYNFVYISLSNPAEVLNLEPPKDEWDIHFTRYMERLYDGSDTMDYSVTGCLLNPHLTEAYFDEEFYQDSTRSYSQLSLDDLDENLLSTRQEIIGHDWKYFDLDAGAYSVLSRKVYFIKDSEGTHYRLRFTGFYDDSGQKGAVTFEYLPL